MSSPETVTEPRRSKTEVNRGRRLLIAAVVSLVGAFVVLIAGVILMNEDSGTLKKTTAELKPLQGNFVFLSLY